MIKERRRKKRGNLSRKNFNSDFDDSEESEKNNDDKEGKILIQNYVDVIHKTF